LHVLLVDDDSLRRALARTIRLAGFEVEAFGSVEALLARGVPEHAVCLVLDVDLPGIDGIEPAGQPRWPCTRSSAEFRFRRATRSPAPTSSRSRPTKG
jgi:DNA-binding response OmpR family regulator